MISPAIVRYRRSLGQLQEILETEIKKGEKFSPQTPRQRVVLDALKARLVEIKKSYAQCLMMFDNEMHFFEIGEGEGGDIHTTDRYDKAVTGKMKKNNITH